MIWNIPWTSLDMIWFPRSMNVIVWYIFRNMMDKNMYSYSFGRSLAQWSGTDYILFVWIIEGLIGFLWLFVWHLESHDWALPGLASVFCVSFWWEGHYLGCGERSSITETGITNVKKICAIGVYACCPAIVWGWYFSSTLWAKELVSLIGDVYANKGQFGAFKTRSFGVLDPNWSNSFAQNKHDRQTHDPGRPFTISWLGHDRPPRGKASPRVGQGQMNRRRWTLPYCVQLVTLLLVAADITTSNKKLLVTKGIATTGRSKNATSSYDLSSKWCSCWSVLLFQHLDLMSRRGSVWQPPKSS